jgi:hypothetical protein
MKVTKTHAILLGIFIAAFVLLILSRSVDGFQDLLANPIEQTPGIQAPLNPKRGNSNVPAFSDEDEIRTYIENKPPPPGVDMTDAVIYAPVDLAADIKKIKDQIRNIELNGSSAVSEELYHQAVPIVGGILRQAGFPLTDETYGNSECGVINS